MPVPSFDESIKAEKLPLEVFRWLSEAAVYVRSAPGSAEEVYNVLKLLLRLLAVRNPESQSHATREALGLLIECIYSQPDTEKVVLDLLALLIRMVDASQSHKYNPMKHLAISSLGHLAKFLSVHMKQMSANVFLICVDSIKIAPVMPETLRYRNTLLWTMRQSATGSIDEASIKIAIRTARSMIDSAGDGEVDVQTVIRGFDLLGTLIKLPASHYGEKKLDNLHSLFLSKGISSTRREIRVAAAKFYSTALISFSSNGLRHDMSEIVNTILKLQNNKMFGISTETSSRVDGYYTLLRYLLEAQEDLGNFESVLDEWMASLLLRLDPSFSRALIVDIIVQWKLNGIHPSLDIIAVLLRQLAFAQAPTQRNGSTSKSKSLANSKPRLESTLACLTSTVVEMGSSVQPVTHAIHQATLGLVMNGLEPLTEEQLAWCIQCLIAIIRSMPPLLISTIEIGLKQLEINTPDTRKLQVAYVISAMVAQSGRFTLYSDVELNSRVAVLGAAHIKQQEDFLQYKVGWALLYGIFCLGPNVVKPLVPQLLLLWEGHLSELACQSTATAERSLTGLAIFLVHNRTLLTTDVVSRLSNTLSTVWSVTGSTSPAPLIRRRLLQCYEQLLLADKLTVCPSSLLMKFVAHVTSPTAYSKEAGVTIESAISAPKVKARSKSPEASGPAKINPLLLFEISNAIESGSVSTRQNIAFNLADDVDFVVFCDASAQSYDEWPFLIPNNVYTDVVDLAVSVTSKLLPSQPLRIQESVFDAILANLENTVGQNSLRKLAVSLNIATLIYSTLQNGIAAEDRIYPVIITIIKILLGNDSKEVRELAALSCGILAQSCKGDSKATAYLAPLVKELLEFSVANNYDLGLRSGSILALGHIAQERSERSLLDAMFRVFMRLAADPRSEIHVPIVTSMRRSLMTSDLIDQKYVRLTLKTLSLTYLLESHSNFLPFQREVAECLTQIVSRIGPLLSTESQESNRAIITCLADQLQANGDVNVRVLAWKSFIEIYYYARHGIDWSLFIKRWRNIIIDTHSLKVEVEAAVSGLLILMKLSARSIFAIAGNGFEDALWLLLDKYPRNQDLHTLFIEWLSQTTSNDADVVKWIRTLDSVVMKPRYFFLSRLKRAIDPGSFKKTTKGHEKSASVNPSAIAADEDVALEVQTDETSNEQFSWEARNFALSMLLYLLQRELRGKTNAEKSNSTITRMIGDVIKIAFSSATSQILGLQYTGLLLLNETVLQLSGLADPDFPHISLLEQYQVQIISALTPAFGSDSSPGLALNALNTCATFIVSDIVKSREKLNRLIKIVEDSLDSMNGVAFRLGRLEMSEDASRVLRIAVLSVWAQIQNYSVAKEHLAEIIEPHRALLLELWKEAVYEFGKMNSALVSQWSSSTFPAAVDQMKDTQLRYLMGPIANLTWLKFVRALSTMDEQDGIDNNFRLVLCGLCFQALIEALQSTASAGLGPTTGHIDEASFTVSSYLPSGKRGHLPATQLSYESIPDLQLPNESSLVTFRLSVLQVLSSVLKPTTCGFIMESATDYFDEVIPILSRAMLIGISEEKMAVLRIAHALVAGQPDTDDSVDHFFEILKVAIIPLKSMFPQLFDAESASVKSAPHAKVLDKEQLSLLQYTMDTVINIAQVFREVIQNDLWVCLLKVFEELNHYEPAVVAPSFKRLLEILATQVEHRGFTFVVDALTVSLKRAVERESPVESLLISTAITCTNSRSLYDPRALVHIQRFGKRAGDVLLNSTNPDASDGDRSIAFTSVQCISAVFGACADTPTGGAFAYACLASLCAVVSLTSLAGNEFGADLIKQSATALSLYAVLDGTLEVFAVVVPSLVLVSGTYGRHLLLQLLTKHPSTFKQTIWQMDAEDQNTIQGLLASATGSNASDQATADESSDLEDEGQIALKSFV